MVGFFPLAITQQWCSVPWRCRLPPQASHLQSSSLPPVPSGCLLMANSSPLPGSALQSPRSSTQPLSAVVDTLEVDTLRLGGQGRAQHPICSSHGPAATRGLPCSLPQRMRLSFCPNWAPAVRGPPGCRHLLSLQIPPSLQVPSQFLSSSFSFFFSGPTWLCRNLSCPFRWWRFFASVQRGLCENCSNSDVFLMHLWREMNSNLPNPLAS